MRILFLTPGWSPEYNGIGDYTYLLSQELQKAGAQITVLTKSRLSKLGRTFSDGSGSSIRIIGAGPRWDIPTLFLTLPSIRKLQPDIVHLQYEEFGFHKSFLIPLFWTQLRGERVVTLHEASFHSAVQKVRDRILCQSSNHVFVNDLGCLEYYQKLKVSTGVSKLGVGSNIPVIQTQLQEIKSGLIRIGYFGFFRHIKRIGLLLKTLRDLLEEGHLDFEMVLVGEFLPKEESHHQSLLDLRNKLGLQDKARFTGGLAASDVSKTLAACHMAVLPFADGATPRRGSFQACMALGIPTITTRSPTPDPEIRHDETAFLLNSLSRNNLKEAILALSKDSSRRSRLRRGALEFHKQYTWDRIAEHHLVIYEQLKR